MGQRMLHDSLTQGQRHVDYELSFLPQGASAPILGEGDPKGTYVTLTRTGVGVFSLVTKDPYLAIVATSGSVSLATPAGQWSVCFGVYTKNANNTWTLPLTLFNVGTATDIAANASNIVSLYIRFRNGTVLP